MKLKNTNGISWKWIVLWSLWLTRIVRQPTQELKISSGLLRGSIAHDGSHVNYLGIPYASVGKRFQPPGPEPKWTGTFDAVDEHVHCYQKSGNIVTGQEDCLIINVYTPLNTSPDDAKPVMVWIHGGGFLMGSSSRFLYGPENLVTKDVILVTFNYRINVQGFLCLRTAEVPGNAGLKDQLAALTWVQKNIRAFGGDPDNVTLFGESAGAASVSLHILSPKSKGLFHKAIMQSGSSLAPWAIQPEPILIASRLAQALGHQTADTHELYDIFMNKTDVELTSAEIPRPVGGTFMSEVIYLPCIEAKYEQSFLTDLPHDILSNGSYNKVPMIIGTNEEEGYFFTAMENSTMLSKIKLENSLPNNLVFPSDKQKKDAANLMKTVYMADKDISKENIIDYSKFIGEMNIDHPVFEEIELHLKTNKHPIYSYLFTYDGWRNFVKFVYGGLSFAFTPGATHADDLLYLFNPHMTPSMWEYKMLDRMATLWTNFAKYGEPAGSAWPRTVAHDPQKLRLNTGPLEMVPLWHTTTVKYWRELYRKYRRSKSGL